MSDKEWDSEEPTSTPAPPRKPIVTKSKWEGEDEDDKGPVSDWEASSDEEEEKPKTAAAAPPKKKGTLKAKLAEKAAEKAARQAAGEYDEDDDLYDEDAVLDPRLKAKLDKERELKSDLSNAAELLGTASSATSSSAELNSLLSAQPQSKEDFIKFSDNIIAFITKRIEDKPLYHTFVEHHARALAAPLRDVEVRKVASGLTTLANEKQKEARDKAAGKKKPKTAGKPILGAAKVGNRIDTSAYDEALDDFGSNADDFM
ncbi:translation initiation factor eIF3 subunit [Cristinia sonorae]|uniref:Eukaryotic translation initiation factor 3 subunit J n=1 Tax=Cristinia sonorae TaxID=1940300 RepID=A0A8K0UPA6_9AGAR|nr:translation initiation factor eIF3 subunit [Cristinia sonorae]